MMHIVKTDIADQPAYVESTYSRPLDPLPASPSAPIEGIGRCLFSIVISSMVAMLLAVSALTAVVYKLSGPADAAPMTRGLEIDFGTISSVVASVRDPLAPPPARPGPVRP